MYIWGEKYMYMYMNTHINTHTLRHTCVASVFTENKVNGVLRILHV